MLGTVTVPMATATVTSVVKLTQVDALCMEYCERSATIVAEVSEQLLFASDVH